MSYQNIAFSSDNFTLRGRWYPCDLASEKPCIVMAHGTSATITMALSHYAEEFQKNGFNVLLFDHAGFGKSDGRQTLTINPWVQARGICNAVAYAKSRNGLHNGKIILWGDSFAGMLVLVVGAVIEGLAGIVSFTPPCGFEEIDLKDPNTSFSKLKNILLSGNLEELEEGIVEGPMAVVSSDQLGTPSLLKPIQAFKWFIEHGGQFDSGWVNSVTREIPKTEVPFSPQVTASFISVPTLIVSGKNDEMVHIKLDIQKLVFDKINAPKEFYEINGGHFGAIYPKSDLFWEAITIETNFMKKL